MEQRYKQQQIKSFIKNFLMGKDDEDDVIIKIGEFKEWAREVLSEWEDHLMKKELKKKIWNKIKNIKNKKKQCKK